MGKERRQKRKARKEDQEGRPGGKARKEGQEGRQGMLDHVAGTPTTPTFKTKHGTASVRKRNSGKLLERQNETVLIHTKSVVSHFERGRNQRHGSDFFLGMLML